MTRSNWRLWLESLDHACVLLLFVKRSKYTGWPWPKDIVSARAGPGFAGDIGRQRAQVFIRRGRKFAQYLRSRQQKKGVQHSEFKVSIFAPNFEAVTEF